MNDLFETITKADERQAAWPFPSDRKRAERAAFERLCDASDRATNAAIASVASGKPETEHAEVGTPTCNANILALDLGTQLGWALGLRDGKLRSGTESFAARRNEGPGQRWLKFQAWLGQQYTSAGELQAIYYELVMAHGNRDNPNTLAAHVYGGFEAFLQAFADRNRIKLIGVGVGTIKKSATGKGNAKKEAVIAAMRSRGHRVQDDNHADALALLEYARQQEA
ncbi:MULTISPECIES: polynucleotidyl transferase [unclassified Cupriavidus]|uniref:polynucleotidyl transferase n=1 Tax=unclassified Cupriavidus TaxID=2640874 RepID=UPI00313CA729